MTVVVTNDDGIESPGIHVLARALRDLGHDPIVVAPETDMSGASAAIGRIRLDRPTELRRVTLPEPAAGIPAYAVNGPPGLAALLAARRGIDGIEPRFIVSGINAGANTGHSILHSGTVGAALTAASFGVSALAVSAAARRMPIRWEPALELLPDALELLLAAPRATVLNLNAPALAPGERVKGLRWATLDRFGSFRVAVAARRDTHVQLEYVATGAELDPSSDTALLEAGWGAITALEAIHAVPPGALALQEPPPTPEAHVTSAAPSTTEPGKP